MKEYILKFRKLCTILIQEKGYNKNKIVQESTLTWPTFQKVYEAPIEDIKISASVLGVIQDFIKKHVDDINYAGIESIKEPAPIKAKKVLKDTPTSEALETANQAADSSAMGAPKKGKDKISPSSYEDFISALAEAAKRLPDNVRISISINGHGT